LGLYENEYDLKRVKDLYDNLKKKEKMVAGEFKASYYHDNGGEVDEFGFKVTKKPSTLAPISPNEG
jgi:hypothetical protein